VIRAEAPAAISRARRAVAELAAAHDGLLVEDKGLSLAIHYRLTPELEPLVRGSAEKIARDDGLKLQMGRKVAEICTPGPDKGAALDAFMREPPFAGSRPVFVGDDLTDEDGFAAAEALGGLGVLVGPARETRARLRLEDANAVRSWLEAAVMEDAGP
jgi:trehalose 6-phosphate phosphatase